MTAILARHQARCGGKKGIHLETIIRLNYYDNIIWKRGLKCLYASRKKSIDPSANSRLYYYDADCNYFSFSRKKYKAPTTSFRLKISWNLILYQPYSCSKTKNCPRRFKHRFHLNAHELRCGEIHKCENCGKEYLDKSSLKRHIKDCQVCKQHLEF